MASVGQVAWVGTQRSGAGSCETPAG